MGPSVAALETFQTMEMESMCLIQDIPEANTGGSITSQGNWRVFRGQNGKEYEAGCTQIYPLRHSSAGGRERDLN